MTREAGGWMASLARGVRREWDLHQLADPAWRFLWEPPPPGEWVALHCIGTGHDPQHDEIVALAALRIAGDRLLASERLELVLSPQAGAAAAVLPQAEAMTRLLQFIGPRPIVGYYLDFDLALIDRAAQPLLGVPLPQARIDVSALFHEWKFRQLPPHQQQGNVNIDLRFATLLRELGLPAREAHDALDHAVMAALVFVRLRQMGVA